MKSKKKKFNPRCSICGKFIGNSEFDRDKIKIDFIPDTPFSVESTVFTHKYCLNK